MRTVSRMLEQIQSTREIIDEALNELIKEKLVKKFTDNKGKSFYKFIDNNDDVVIDS